VVFHLLEQVRAKTPQVAAAFDWFNEIMDRLHKQYQLTKAKFLIRPMNWHCRRIPPSQRVQVPLEEMATLLDIHVATARCIRDELAQDGSVKRIGNYPKFLIEREGHRAVERKHTEGGSTLPTIVQNHYYALGGSILQVAANSPHATQTATVGDQLAETHAFAELVTAKLEEMLQLIDSEQFVSLKANLEFLKEKLGEPTPLLPLIAQLAQGNISGLPRS
jgi:hypothetical protein